MNLPPEATHCEGFAKLGENKITLSFTITEAEYAKMKEGEIFIAVTVDFDDGRLDVEGFISEDYPEHSHDWWMKKSCN